MTSQVATDANTVVQPQNESEQKIIELIDQAQKGNLKALDSIYRTYKKPVMRFCYYRVNGDYALAEDICSEAFFRAMHNIDKFEWQGRDFGAWLVTIARNLVADHFKRSRTRLEVSVGEMLDADGAMPGGAAATESHAFEDTVAAELLAKEAGETLRCAIERLNPLQQECIMLRFYDGLSCKETALKMGKQEGAVKTLQYRATASLKRHLGTLNFSM